MAPLGMLMMAAGGFFAVAIGWLTAGSQLEPMVALVVAVIGVGVLGAAMGLLARHSRSLLMLVLPLDVIALVALVDLVLRTFMQTSLRQWFG